MRIVTMWRIVLWSVVWCLVPGGAQYWDTEGLELPPPSAAVPRSLGLSLARSLASDPYDRLAQPGDRGGGAGREKRMAPEDEDTASTLLYDQVLVPESGRRGTKIAVVGKCCAVGHNLSTQMDEQGAKVCASSTIPFQPIFFDFNETGIWDYDINEWETIVGNPCQYGRYLLDPSKYSEDEFYLLRNGSLVAPYHKPPLLGPKEFCMEAFWGPGSPEEPIVLPLVCFPSAPKAPATSPATWDVCISIVILASVPFLLITSVSHLVVREVWDFKGARHCWALGVHTACLSVAFFSLSVTQLAASHLPYTLCVMAAYFIQLSFLACFFWLNILCVDTYLNVKTEVTRQEAERQHCVFCWSEERWRACWERWWWLWGSVTPSVITLVTLLLDKTPGLPVTLHKPNFGAESCWFQSDESTLFYFYGPVSALLLVNVALFVATARSLSRQDKLLNPLSALGRHPLPLTDPDVEHNGTTGLQRWKRYKKVFKLCLALFVSMGISWCLEVLSWLVGGDSPLWYFSDLFNALQGIIIFFIFMSRPVLLLVWRRLHKTFPWLPWRDAEQNMEVVSERTSIGCNGTTRLHPAPV